MKKSLFVLFISIFVAIVTRGYLLGQVPAGLYLDEAAQGYNAYSILKTGKDEFGMPFPAAFRSFADFKTPVYIYLIAPLIPVFGLTAFTVRFPSFFASILTIPLVYLLVLKLLEKSKFQIPNSKFLASLSSLLLAISPWHILFGRTNFECNVALFLFLLAIYLFYLGLKKPIWLIFSAITFAVALPAYHSERVLVPLMLIFLFLLFRKNLFTPPYRAFSLTGLFLGLIISLPTIAIISSPGFLARVNTLNIGQSLPGQITGLSKLLSSFVNFPPYLHLKDFLSLYLAYFSPRNLFSLGDSGPRSSFPELSTFFFWQLPLYLHGFYLLFKKKELEQLRVFTIFLFLISPIPAALTRDPFSTIRSLPLVVPITIMISLSLADIWQRLKTSKQRLIGLIVFILLLVYSLLKLYSSIFILNERLRAPYWDYGWQQVMQVLNDKTDTNLPVVIDNARAEPYSQILFYSRLDPTTYQKENFEVSLDEYYSNLRRVTNKKIGRFEVRGISWSPDLSKKQYLFGDYLAISEEQIQVNNLKLIAVIKYPDGSVAYRIVLTQPK